jgi:hypothetical protein
MQNNGGEEVFHPKGSGLSNIGYPTYQVRTTSHAKLWFAADLTTLLIVNRVQVQVIPSTPRQYRFTSLLCTRIPHRRIIHRHIQDLALWWFPALGGFESL